MIFEQNQFEELGPLSCKEFESDEGKKGWAGRIPKSENARREFCPWGSRGWVDDEREGELASLQERLEEAAATVKAMTMATSNKNKFTILAQIRKLATEAGGKMQEPHPEERAQEKCEESQARPLMPGWVPFQPVV